MSKKLTIEFILNKANHNNPKSIRVLNLRGSQISDISILSELTALESISLSANQIKDISVFKKLKNIRELYLKDNQINDFAQFENLKNCKKIEKLAIKGNPITTMPNYIQKIVEILPQIKKLDDIELKQFKLNIINNKNGNFNSPLIKKDSNQSQKRNIDLNNNYIIQSPNISNNNISIKSGSESISSDIKGEAKNVSAAPDPRASLFPPNLSDNLNIDEYNSNNNNGMNVINSYNGFNLKLNNNHLKEKSDLLNRSFKKKITEGSFRKVAKKKNNLNNINNINNNITQEGKKQQLLERSINDNKLKTEKLSQTLSSGFYKNPFKGLGDGGNQGDKGGYRKKIIGNFKQEQEHKENNKNKQNVINTVFQKYQYFDNDNENEEQKKKNSESPQKKSIFQKFNLNNPVMTTSKKNENLQQKINSINEENKSNNIIVENGKKEERVNKSVVESIKLLMSTLSVEGLKQIESDIKKLIEIKNKS